MLYVYLPDLVPKRDLDINGNHIKRAGTAQREITLRDDYLLKESQQLNQSLRKMGSDLDLTSKHLQCSEREAMNAKGKASEVYNNAGTIQETANSQTVKECEETMGESNAYAVALVMKLLSLEEEAKEMRKQAEEGRKKYEELLCKLKDHPQSQRRIITRIFNLVDNSDTKHHQSVQPYEYFPLRMLCL